MGMAGNGRLGRVNMGALDRLGWPAVGERGTVGGTVGGDRRRKRIQVGGTEGEVERYNG